MVKKTPFDYFFSLGDKVTKGDPYRHALFNFYLLGIMFFAFMMIAISSFLNFINNNNYASLGWGIVTLIIMWFQFFTWKAGYELTKTLKSIKDIKPSTERRIETATEMLDSFKQ